MRWVEPVPRVERGGLRQLRERVDQVAVVGRGRDAVKPSEDRQHGRVDLRQASPLDSAGGPARWLDVEQMWEELLRAHGSLARSDGSGDADPLRIFGGGGDSHAIAKHERKAGKGE